MINKKLITKELLSMQKDIRLALFYKDIASAEFALSIAKIILKQILIDDNKKACQPKLDAQAMKFFNSLK